MQKVPLAELSYFVGNVLAMLAMLPVKSTARVVALRGDLGSGKTTFAAEFAKQLGVTDIVQSPTYVLMKSYPFPNTRNVFGRPRRHNRLIHIDAYRLASADEFAALKPQVFLNDPKALVLSEWPERVEPALPKPDLTINFSSAGAAEGERYIETI